MNLKSFNKIITGKPGGASKTITFKEKDFKKELAPANARIECVEMNGEKFVRMTYGSLNF